MARDLRLEPENPPLLSLFWIFPTLFFSLVHITHQRSTLPALENPCSHNSCWMKVESIAQNKISSLLTHVSVSLAGALDQVTNHRAFHLNLKC